MGAQEELLAVTPLDGRYASRVESLQPILSEYGLIKYRVAVEAGWLGVLGSGVLPDVEPFGDEAQAYLRTVAGDFNIEDAAAVKEIERTTNHDVKAVENWLRGKLGGLEPFSRHLELIHFGATSEDINNLAYAMQLRDTRGSVLVPHTEKIAETLEERAAEYAEVPMLARTHGQPASPTTLGKEFKVFSDRLFEHAYRLGAVSIMGKFNGATGNYNALQIAYPDVDWRRVTSQFVNSLGFEVNPTTTQIEPHDWTAAFCSEVALGNTIMLDFARDMWSYISNHYFKQEVKAGEVGSSTMPHKVNPIDFENAEANFQTGNAILDQLARKLPVSRWQRDLSDSSSQRTFGEALGHTVVGQKSLQRGLGKVHPNFEAIAADLDKEWSVLTEAVQTVMRRYGVSGAYEAIKQVSRGQALDHDGYMELVESLDLPDEPKQRLRELTPRTYIGLAPQIALS